MRNTVLLGAALIAAACASAPVHTAAVDTKSGRADALFYDTSPDEVISQLSGICMDSGLSVVGSTTTTLTCEANMSVGQSVMTKVAIGNSYSTAPRQFVRMSVAQIGENVRVQASSWVETQMAFGQIRKINIDQTPQQITELTSFLLSAGGRLAPGDSITYKGPRLGFEAVEIDSAMVANFPADHGVSAGFYLVVVSENLPAQQAGMKVCDKIVRFGGVSVNSLEDLRSMDYETKAVTIQRDSKNIDLKLTPVLGENVFTGTEYEPPEQASAKRAEKYQDICLSPEQ